MKLVVDANILFSSLITDGKTIELFLNQSFSLCAPEFVLEEIEEHKAEIISKSKRSEKEFNEIFSLLKSLINIVPKEEFQECIKSAEDICPDKDDVHYLALALKLKCAVWSNDKLLKKKQNVVKIYGTSELISLI